MSLNIAEPELVGTITAKTDRASVDISASDGKAIITSGGLSWVMWHYEAMGYEDVFYFDGSAWNHYQVVPGVPK